MLIHQFYHEGGSYKLYYQRAEFTLSLCPSFDYLEKHYGEAALLYVDDETLDDVNEINNPFHVIAEVVKAITEYVRTQQVSYFYFISSTPRKERIYPWLGKKIVNSLAQQKQNYQCEWHQNKFYFWRVKEKNYS